MRTRWILGAILLPGLVTGCRAGMPRGIAPEPGIASRSHSFDTARLTDSDRQVQPVSANVPSPEDTESGAVVASATEPVLKEARTLAVQSQSQPVDQSMGIDITATMFAGAEQPIDLTTALAMTTGQNPQVAFARARIEEALAQLDRAQALKLPSIRAGMNYNKHEGRIQDVAGTVIETSRGSFYSGLGANAVGAGSPAVPGIVSQFHVADAIFLPRIAQRTAAARRAGAVATTNDQLLATALAYTELLRAEQEMAVVSEIVARARELERATGEFAQAGQGLVSDHDRARTELALRLSEQARAEEAAAVASARLAESIRWDASVRLVPAEPQLVPIELVGVQCSAQELVAQALGSRPELAQSRQLVAEAVERLRREEHAPLVPSVLLAASYGGLGGGLGSDLTNYGDRFDGDAVAVWEMRQLGIGERAARREARSRITQARIQELAMMDRVAREVTEAAAQVASRRRQIDITTQAVVAADDSFQQNWQRIRNGQGLPIEVLQAVQALATARREQVRAIADYNTAQFTLQRALGWPCSDS